jgi:4-amino-4-deoxy-L-arabinose transferase-like glycosyltransferase
MPRVTEDRTDGFTAEPIPWRPVLLVGSLALFVRVLYVIVQDRAHLFDAVFVAGDSVFYLRLASAIASGAGMSLGGKPTAYVGPGYPLFLVPFVSVGADPIVVGLGQALVGAIGVAAGALTAWVLAQRYRPPWGTPSVVIAGLLGAFYPHLVFWTGYLLTETIFVSLIAIGLMFLVLAWHREHAGAGLAAGAAFGLAAITRPPALAMLLGLAIWWLVSCVRRRTPWTSTALFLIAALMPVLAWGTRNMIELGAFITTSTESGEVFFQGNSRSSTGGSRGYVDALDYTPLVLPNDISEVERDHIYLGQALAEMREDPVRVVARWPAKIGNMWRLTYESASVRNTLITALSYPPVLIVGVVGAVLLARRDLFGPGIVPALFLVGWTTLHMLVTGMIRFRLAAEHVLIVAAPFALLTAWSLLRRR